MRHAAYTLLEVVIALGIFMMVMAGVLQALTSSNRMIATVAVQDDVQLGQAEVLRQMTADLTASGWYFYQSEDANASGTLDAGEDIDANGALNDVVYNVDGDPPTADRKLRYYPFVNVAIDGLNGLRFPSRRYPGALGGATAGYHETTSLATSASALARNELARLSPWSSAGSVAQLQTDALRMNIAVPSDLALEMVSPSSDLIFLRAAIGPWSADPGDAEQAQLDDMVFFPGFANDSSGALVPLPGALASAWNIYSNHDNLPRIGTRNTVLFPSEYMSDGSGGFMHRNATALVAATSPYGVRAWGSRLDDAGSGPKLSLQWEAIAADRMDRDPTAGVDNPMPPDDIREFVYALLPSPLGLGRLVRAHAVIKALGETPLVGVERGDWISDPLANRGWVIDRVLSDDVVRVQWWTRRHDRSLSPNQVRLRLVMARAADLAGGTSRNLHWRDFTTSFTMWASNEYEDTKTSQALIDVASPASAGVNVKLDY